MVFSSPLFLLAYLPLFFALYYLVPRSLRNGVAVVGSVLFYAWGAPRFVGVLIAASFIDYTLSKFVAAENGSRRAGWFVALSVGYNLALLAYCKYLGFFLDLATPLLKGAGLDLGTWGAMALPLGVSFFTFHKVSYTVDVYRGVVKPASSFPLFLLYIFLFPQLIAGPIIRYHDIESQLVERKHSLEKFSDGIVWFVIGLAKKVLIADPLGLVADAAFRANPSQLGVFAAWLGIVSYSFQIYFDFSGYSEMAIGLGRMMGFEFPKNFNHPYIAQTITEFWRRWHITLSSWMREYLYIPLGGNRVSWIRQSVNLWIVFLLSGFWHGAQWTFVAWGAFHGLFLTLDKVLWSRVAAKLPTVVNVIITFVVVMIGWVLFRAPTLGYAERYIGALFGFVADMAASPLAPRNDPLAFMTNRTTFVLGVAVLLSFAPLFMPSIERLVRESQRAVFLRFLAPVRVVGVLAIYLLSLMTIASSRFHPFIYFRF